MMEECKKNGVYTVSILDYWSNYKNRFLIDERLVWPDCFIVMDDIAKKEALADGVPQQIIEVLGHPGLDEVLHKRIEIGFPAPAAYGNNVLLLGEPTAGRKWLGYTADLFFEESIDVLIKLGYNISIKFHPRDEADLQTKYSAFRVNGDLLGIALRHDIIIGMTTIALLHCALLGKNTISYQPGLACRDGCISNKLGLSKLIVSQKDLLEFMSQPNFEGELKRDDLIWMDGKSTDRIVQFLEELS